MKAAVIDTQPGENTLVFTEPRTVEKIERREIAFEWVVSEPGKVKPGDVGLNSDRVLADLAVLSVYHYADRKAFFASLHPESQLESQSGFKVRRTPIKIGVPAPFRYAETVSRYSEKRLREFAATALDLLREQAQDPEVAATFGVEPVTTFAVAEKGDDESTLSWLQSLVGGDIEPITMRPARYEGYINEDGKYLNGGLPRNEVATELWTRDLLAEYGDDLDVERLRGDYVAGPLVIVGPLTEDGDTTGIPDDAIAELEQYVKEATAA